MKYTIKIKPRLYEITMWSFPIQQAGLSTAPKAVKCQAGRVDGDTRWIGLLRQCFGGRPSEDLSYATPKSVGMTTAQIKQYLATVPQNRQLRFKSINALILELYPDADVSFRYNMPTFEWHGGWVALANQKNYISLYTCSAQHLQEFKQRHPNIKTGKGCINFRDKDEIPLADLVGVIHSAMTSHTN